MTLLTFIVPVRHQDNARDWSVLKKNLVQTLASISAQNHNDWRGLVVCNHGADLPDLPERFDVVRVGFPPNSKHERSDRTTEEFYDAFRIDKGRRVLAGMLAAPNSEYYMIVDDDDLVSNRLARFVADNRGAPGWTFTHGYVWSDGGHFVYRLKDFNQFCGTSSIVARQSYDLPKRFEEASSTYIMDYLGSHVRILKLLEKSGRRLHSLPFRGAVYRVGHAGAHSKSSNLIGLYLLNSKILRRPLTICVNIFRFRLLRPALYHEFFASGQ